MSDTNGGQTPLSDTLADKPCRDCFNVLKCGPGWLIAPDCCSEYLHWKATYTAGQQEGEKERDALRTEVEVLRRAVDALATRLDDKDDCISMGECPFPLIPWNTRDRDEILSIRCVKCLSEWAISEARKGE